MRAAAKILSLLSLALVSIPCWLMFAGTIQLETVQWTALIGTLSWFVSTPAWMGRPG